jgi:hypothetical protein
MHFLPPAEKLAFVEIFKRDSGCREPFIHQPMMHAWGASGVH